jgi:hypothetical protein
LSECRTIRTAGRHDDIHKAQIDFGMQFKLATAHNGISGRDDIEASIDQKLFDDLPHTVVVINQEDCWHDSSPLSTGSSKP